MTIEIQTRIINRLGLHARAATQLVNCASEFQAAVFLKLGERQVNGKSIMGVLMLAAAFGSTITLEIRGDDQDAAMEALVELVESGFGELAQ